MGTQPLLVWQLVIMEGKNTVGVLGSIKDDDFIEELTVEESC